VSSVHRGLEGGARGFGGSAPEKKKKKIPQETCHVFRWFFFDTWFFPMVFYFRLRN
jgi:hypothetical protein